MAKQQVYRPEKGQIGAKLPIKVNVHDDISVNSTWNRYISANYSVGWFHDILIEQLKKFLY